MRRLTCALTVSFACLLLAACGSDNAAAPSQQSGEETLPKPDAAAGSVTGMPNPGAPLAPPPADELAIDDDPGLEIEDADAIDPNMPVDPPASGDMEKADIPPEMFPPMPAPTPEPTESRATPPSES